jgi:hypothetical protein
MGSQANQLSQINTVNDLSLSDLIIIFTNANGDSRKSSINTLLEKFREEFTRPDFDDTINSPINGFSISLNTTGKNEWLILTPASTLATGTIVFPTVAESSDGQEILITCSQDVTSLTIDPSDASGFFGAPTTIQTNQPIHFRYKKTLKSWFKVN